MNRISLASEPPLQPSSSAARHLAEPCASIQQSLSDYADGAVTGVEMQQISTHLASCTPCSAEFSIVCRMQETLATIGAAKAPPELGLRLQLAISYEQARSWSSRLERLGLSWQNSLRPFVMKTSAGLACATALMSGVLFLLGAMSTANPVMANDEPLGAMTAPHYLYSIAGIQPVTTPQDGTVVIDASINALGQVYSYRILSGPQEKTMEDQVVDRLLASVFEPARVFGVPVRGHVIMTFAGVSVTG